MPDPLREALGEIANVLGSVAPLWSHKERTGMDPLDYVSVEAAERECEESFDAGYRHGLAARPSLSLSQIDWLEALIRSAAAENRTLVEEARQTDVLATLRRLRADLSKEDDDAA